MSFFIACVFQAIWILLYLNDSIYASMIAMILILLPLPSIVIAQQYESSLYAQVQSYRKLTRVFWLLRFPFELHCGRILVASILNANILLVALQTDMETRLAASIISLGIVWMVTTLSIFATKKTTKVYHCVGVSLGYGKSNSCFLIFQNCFIVPNQIHRILSLCCNVFDDAMYSISMNVRKMTLDNKIPWEGILASTMFALRARVHTTTQYTPTYLAFDCGLILNA